MFISLTTISPVVKFYHLFELHKQTFLGYKELPNELNKRDIKIKNFQKPFSACHQGQSLPSFFLKTKFRSHMKENDLQIQKMLHVTFFDFHREFKTYGTEHVFNKNAQKSHL